MSGMEPPSHPTVNSLLAGVVDEFTDRYLRGEEVEVEAYARAHPAHAELLRQVLAPIVALGRGLSGSATETGRSAVDNKVPEIPGYEVLEEIGRGGMGVVYRARHTALDRMVALKVIRLDRTLEESARERFRAEVRAVASVKHAGIVQIFEVGEVEGVCYCTLELIDGGSLAEAIRGEPQAPRWAAGLIEQLAIAMQVAHEHGLIHRDLKPGNVLLAEGGVGKIADFGLVKWVDRDSSLTQTGAIVGTPSYMAPEQASEAKELTTAVDIHALGAILYELITGRPPYKGSTILETLTLVRDSRAVAPRHLQPNCPRDLEVIIEKCLHKDPGGRYGTAIELAADLRRFLDGRPIQARSPGVIERGQLWARRNPLPASLATLLMVVLAVGVSSAAILAYHWRNAAVRAQANAEQAERERNEAVRQRRAADEALFETLMTQAASIRQRGGKGQRVESLAILAQAVELWRREDMPDREKRETRLRDEMMSCLMLPDLRVAREIPCPNAGVAGVSFDAALERCCWSEEDRLVRVVRVADGATLCRIAPRANSRDVLPLLSPDGRYVAVRHGDGGVDVWRIEAGEARYLFGNRAAHINGVAFTTDGRLLALGQQDCVQIVSVPEGKEQHRVRFPEGGRVTLARWHPGKPMLACSRADSWQVDLVDATAGKILGALRHRSAVHGISWNPVWPFLGTGCADGKAYFWEYNSRQIVLVVPAHESAGTRLQFNPTGSLVASIAWNHALALWSAPVGNPISRVRVGPMGRLQFSPDGLEVGPELANGKIRTWRVIPEAELRLYTLQANDSLQPALSPDGKLLAVGMPTQGLLLWDARTGRVLDHLLTPAFERLRFVSNDVLLGGYSQLRDGKSKLYRIPVNREHGLLGEPRLLLETTAIEACEFDCDRSGRLLVQGTGDGVAVWQLRPEEVRSHPKELPPVDLAQRSNPLRRTLGGLLGGIGAGVARAPIRRFTAPDGRYATISPDGKYVACGSHLQLGARVWQVEDGKLVATLPTSRWTFVEFDPSGRWLATHDGHCRLWRVGSWEEGAQIAASDRRRSVRPTLSPDGRLIAFGDGHRKVRLVETESGRDLAQFDVTQVIHRLEFSRDGRWLIGVSERGAVGVLDLVLLRHGVEKMQVSWNLPIAVEPPGSEE